MNKKKGILIAFGLLVLAQLFAPAKMIFDREAILDQGKEYKFKVAPVDPSDPFVGKYIYLNYKESEVKVQNGAIWNRGDIIYLLLGKDKDGFVKIKSGSALKPGPDKDFIKAKVNYPDYGNKNTVQVEYPFDRFYMEEYKAPEAELRYNKAQRDTNEVTWASVFVKDGESVLHDVLIDGVPIGEVIKKERRNRK